PGSSLMDWALNQIQLKSHRIAHKLTHYSPVMRVTSFLAAPPTLIPTFYCETSLWDAVGYVPAVRACEESRERGDWTGGFQRSARRRRPPVQSRAGDLSEEKRTGITAYSSLRTRYSGLNLRQSRQTRQKRQSSLKSAPKAPITPKASKFC